MIFFAFLILLLCNLPGSESHLQNVKRRIFSFADLGYYMMLQKYK